MVSILQKAIKYDLPELEKTIINLKPKLVKNIFENIPDLIVKREDTFAFPSTKKFTFYCSLLEKGFFTNKEFKDTDYIRCSKKYIDETINKFDEVDLDYQKALLLSEVPQNEMFTRIKALCYNDDNKVDDILSKLIAAFSKFNNYKKIIEDVRQYYLYFYPNQITSLNSINILYDKFKQINLSKIKSIEQEVNQLTGKYEESQQFNLLKQSLFFQGIYETEKLNQRQDEDWIKNESKNKADNLNTFLKESGATFDYLLIADADEALHERFVEKALPFFYSSKIDRLAYVTPLNQTYRTRSLFSNYGRFVENFVFFNDLKSN